MATYPTTRFSDIEVKDDEILVFPNGLLGLEELKHFSIVPHPGGGPLEWLQSLQAANMAFVICDPSMLVEEYEIKISEPEIVLIEASSIETLDVKVIVRVSTPPQKPTVNLLGPLLINKEKNLGMQYIINHSDWSCRHELGN